jgi:Copper binding proteins, plastocyanin/azurin family
MSPAVARPGRVVFAVANKGAVAHDLVFAKGGRTRILQPGQRQTLTVSFSKSGAYRFYCSVPGHQALGMRGTLRVGAATAAKPKPRSTGSGSASPQPVGGLALTPVATGLQPLTDVVAPPADTSRLLIVQQNGLVLLLKDGRLQQQPFLDLRPVVQGQGEKGLLSIAFAPDYVTSGTRTTTTRTATSASSSTTARWSTPTAPTRPVASSCGSSSRPPTTTAG